MKTWLQTFEVVDRQDLTLMGSRASYKWRTLAEAAPHRVSIMTKAEFDDGVVQIS